MMNKGYVFRNERHYGPLDITEIKEMISRGLISTNHFYWQPGMHQWERIGKFEQFKSYESLNKTTCSDIEFENTLRSDIRYSQRRYPQSIGQELPFQMKTEYFNESENSSKINKTDETVIQQDTIWASSKRLGVVKTARKKIFFYMLVLLLAIGSSLFLNINSHKSKMLSGLSKLQQHKIENYLNSAESDSPSAEFIHYQNNQSEDSLVIATNVKPGSEIIVQLKGIGETLIGEHTLVHNINHIVNENIFTLKRIKRNDGRFLPYGKYIISISCTNCRYNENLVLTEGMEYLGKIENKKNYSFDLNNYHSKVRLLAESELIELKNIANALDVQNEETMNKYNQFKNYKYKWNYFNAKWLDLQNSIIDAFSELQDPEFFSKLFYAPIYLNLQVISQDVLSLNQTQNLEIVNNNLTSDRSIKTQQMYQENKKRIKDANVKIDLMKFNFENSKGMPSREGL
ncbi:MAG: DUF4339 domain-containing protein [Bdellovibrionaceae bacterium]|nr:DUF4339 domain-containing protein [Pseudobdellovibrionaceae bacterium]